MVKKEVIVMRVDVETKKRIETAASTKGQSVTTFVLEAATKAAKRVEDRPPTKGRFRGVPNYFRYGCMEASRGGSMGYETPAWHLAIHVGGIFGEIPYDVEPEEWETEVDRLRDSLGDEDEEAVWEWFGEHYPKCMALVPKRRWRQFVKGVFMAFEEDRV